MSRLRLYNTLTRSKEDFEPIDPANVRMYVCGPTVYDYAHIGNARPAIVFDVLYRLLQYLAKQGTWDEGRGETKVTYVRNITDVDDKINDRAARDYPDLPLNEAIRRVTETTANQYQADTTALGCLPPTEQPRATENINQMIEVIEALIARGHAYEAAGEVLFSVPSMPDYGRLSRRTLDEQQAGARIAVEAHKRNPADFVLWKLSSENEPGWASPWGRGRPGWHIECSAMSRRYLGETFDIHGGGLDLIFPHHENEIAQSRCAFGHDVMAKVWMHNGFLQVEGEKMSKSLGNFVTINELLETAKFGGRAWPGDVLRLAMLKTHYRQPIDFSLSAIEESRKQLLSWSETIETHKLGDCLPTFSSNDVLNALCDDLNSPLAINEIDKIASKAKRDPDFAILLLQNAKALGLKNLRKPGYFHPHISVQIMESGPQFSDNERILVFTYLAAQANANFQLAESKMRDISERGFRMIENDVGILSIRNDTSAEFDRRVDSLKAARLEARKNKNWAESDRIRDELAAMGVTLKDNKDGTTTWEVKR